MGGQVARGMSNESDGYAAPQDAITITTATTTGPVTATTAGSAAATTTGSATVTTTGSATVTTTGPATVTALRQLQLGEGDLADLDDGQGAGEPVTKAQHSQKGVHNAALQGDGMLVDDDSDENGPVGHDSACSIDAGIDNTGALIDDDNSGREGMASKGVGIAQRAVGCDGFQRQKDCQPGSGLAGDDVSGDYDVRKI